MKIITTIAVAAGLATLAACNESPREERADAIEENAEMQAENLEEMADNATTEAQEDNLEAQAEQVLENGEAAADAVEDGEANAI